MVRRDEYSDGRQKRKKDMDRTITRAMTSLELLTTRYTSPQGPWPSWTTPPLRCRTGGWRAGGRCRTGWQGCGGTWQLQQQRDFYLETLTTSPVGTI